MWLYVPNLPSSPCAPDTADSHSLSGSQSHALDPSATWNGKPTPPASWRRVWKAAPFLRRLSGVTCEPSMVTRGVEEWIASLPGSPASLGALPGSAEASPMPAGCGPTSLGSLAKFNPDFASLRTSGGLFPDMDSSPFSATLPVSGSMRSGVLFARPMSVRPIGESESSSWLTPDCPNGGRVNGADVGPTGMSSDGRKRQVGLGNQASNCPTPDANHSTQSNRSPSPGAAVRPNLAALAPCWPTPRASANENRNTQPCPSHGVTHGKTLAGEACGWSTPIGKDAGKRSGGKRKTADLSTQCELWGTPASRDARFSQPPNDTVPTNGLLSRQVHRTGTLGLESSPASPASPLPSKRRLNPRFVEWLMGLPFGWLLPDPTSCGQAETELFLYRQRRLLSYWLAAQDGSR